MKYLKEQLLNHDIYFNEYITGNRFIDICDQTKAKFCKIDHVGELVGADIDLLITHNGDYPLDEKRFSLLSKNVKKSADDVIEKEQAQVKKILDDASANNKKVDVLDANDLVQGRRTFKEKFAIKFKNQQLLKKTVINFLDKDISRALIFFVFSLNNFFRLSLTRFIFIPKDVSL